jgi:hypothetical protein
MSRLFRKSLASEPVTVDLQHPRMAYAAPWWLPGGNSQTIWAAKCAKRFDGVRPLFTRERWHTPDSDFIDVDFATHAADVDAPLLVVFHGLEGSSSSHYALAFTNAARARGWACAIPHFRGCSGELNLAPRAYHSGDFEEIDWILRRFRVGRSGPLFAVGVSLGGNALMRWAGEFGAAAGQVVSSVASVCSPLDLTASGHAIGRGFNRLLYTRMFLNSMVPKALHKLDQHPGLFDRKALLAARDLYEFDDVVTAPLHGFLNTEDYWRRASAKPHLLGVGVPALALNACNDPFVPMSSLPDASQVSASLSLWQPAQGGHVGFPSAPFPSDVLCMPEAVAGFFNAQL